MPRKTYEIGYKRRKSRRALIVGVLMLALLGGGYYVNMEFQATTQPEIKNSAGTTRPLEIPNSKTMRFDQGVFAFDAPADWKLINHDTAPYDMYSFRASLTNADNRYLDIYIDKIPQTMAVNRAVAVRAQGNNLAHGETSENCTTFTAATSSEARIAKPLAISAKWDGVEFLCDNDNTTRNVIGTSSPASINKVTLAGPTSGQHSFFFVYTDNNSTPDYSIFYRILESFVVI
ncbi:MAG TPA: hypothetical protein VF575_04685 [Candidatus Saccharimonadales bacterium]|jgi:hypothetical protein